MDSGNHTIFVWDETMNQDAWERFCPWCGTENILMRGPEDGEYNVHRRCECPLCGWYSSRYIFLMKTTGLFEGIYRLATLRSFDLDSSKLSVEDVVLHLKSHFSDIYSIDWCKFEEIVEGIFRQQGFRTILTQRSLDDRVNLLLLSDDSTEVMIECKKDAKHRTLGIEIISTIEGINIDWDGNRAYIVTNTNVSETVRLNAEDLGKYGYGIDMAAATELAQALGVYNDQYPSLHNLDSEQRTAIIKQNLSTITSSIWRKQ